MPYLALSDATLHYEIGGSGPALVLIAGMCSDSASWGPLVPALEERFTVIRPDNRSCGRTTPTDAPVSVEIWARDVRAVLDHLGIGRAAVMGHSLGGLIGLHLAMTSGRVERLAMLAAAPIRLPRNDSLFALLLGLRGPGMPGDLWLRAFFPWLFHPRFYDHPEAADMAVAQSLAYPHAQSPGAMAHQAAGLAGFNPTPMQSGPDCPVLAVLSSDDLLMPIAAAKPAFARFAKLTLAEVSGAGHSLHWDAPDLVLQHVLPFLSAD